MRSRVINLTFHGIGDPARGLDEGEADVWISRAEFLSVLDSVVGRDDVRITFDDGNASDVEHGLPALRDRGLCATFFVVAGRLSEPGFVDTAGVRALASAGMTIGCHGMRHRPWRALGAASLREELVEAKQALETVVGASVVEAACPFGSYDRRVLHSLQRSGYRTVYTSDGGTASAHSWIQARNTVGPGDDASLVARIASSERLSYQTCRQRTKRVIKRWR